MTEDHDHTHPAEAHAAPQAGAVLDIGGDVGALLLYTDAGRHEQEIYVAPVDDPAHRTHTVVRRHPLHNGGSAYAALFPELAAGSYTIVGTDVTVITIRGGEVTSHTL